MQASNTVTIIISAVNDAPYGIEDYAFAEQDEPLVIHVLDNDSDAEDNTLTIDSASNGDHGSVTIDTENWVVTYYPDEDYVGPDGFTYTVVDGNGGSTTVRVHVQVYEVGVWASTELEQSSGDNSDAAIGAANATYAYDIAAWQPTSYNQREYLTVSFGEEAVSATGLVIREAASITRIEYRSAPGAFATLWDGSDPDASTLTDFVLRFDETYSIQDLRIFIDGEQGGSIDAVRLLTDVETETEKTLSTRGFDGYGQFVVTAYNADLLPTQVDTYSRGVNISTVELAYDNDVLLTQISTQHTLLGERKSKLTYDADGNVLEQVLAYGTASAATTSYVFNEGKMISLTDPVGNMTSWTYSTNETVTTDTFDNDTVEHFDSEGRLEWVVDRDNRKREYSYTVEGTLATEKWYDWDLIGLEWGLVETLSYTYQNGLLVSATNSSGSYELTYDDFGRVIHSVQTIGATEIWLTFGYDQNGYRNLVIDSFGGREESLYDPYGNLLRRILVQEGNTLRIDQSYDSAGRLLGQSRYSDAGGSVLVATTEYAYEWNDRVSSIVHKNATPEVIARFDYDWDLSGELVGKIELQSELNSGDPTTFTFGYDDQGQLTDDGDNEYTYDENGNRTMSGYVTGDDNRILSDGVWSYDYDDEGNIIGKEMLNESERWVYGYDHHNHLVLAKKYNDEDDLVLEAEYRYDPLGNRIEKSVDWDGEGTLDAILTQFAIDGWNSTKPSPVGNENYDVWADLDGSGSLRTRYLRGDGVDELLGRFDKHVDDFETVTWPAFWILGDSLGSVRDVIDDAGALTYSVTYNGYGNISDDFGDAETLGRYAWTGRELDVETGLQYNRARYFDPTIGRWFSQDPMGFSAGDGNLYRYLFNNPIIYTDPSGLELAVGQVAGKDLQKWLSNDQTGFFKSQGPGIDTELVNIDGTNYLIPTNLKKLKAARDNPKWANDPWTKAVLDSLGSTSNHLSVTWKQNPAGNYTDSQGKKWDLIKQTTEVSNKELFSLAALRNGVPTSYLKNFISTAESTDLSTLYTTWAGAKRLSLIGGGTIIGGAIGFVIGKNPYSGYAGAALGGGSGAVVYTFLGGKHNVCEEWVMLFQDRLLENFDHPVKDAKGGIVAMNRYYWSVNDPYDQDHTTLKVEFADGTIFYVDKGWADGQQFHLDGVPLVYATYTLTPLSDWTRLANKKWPP